MKTRPGRRGAPCSIFPGKCQAFLNFTRLWCNLVTGTRGGVPATNRGCGLAGSPFLRRTAGIITWGHCSHPVRQVVTTRRKRTRSWVLSGTETAENASGDAVTLGLKLAHTRWCCSKTPTGLTHAGQRQLQGNSAPGR